MWWPYQMNPNLFLIQFRFSQVPIWIPAALFLSLWDQWKISPTVRTGSLSLFTFTHYVCTDASHFAPLQLGFGLISEIWIDFDFPRSPVEVLKRRIVSLRTELHVSFGNFRKLLVPDVFTLLNWSVRAIRGILNTDCVRGFSHFFLKFVFKVMAERGARLLLSLFCLTITVSHAEKGKTVIKEH